jgi:hypothetical protein
MKGRFFMLKTFLTILLLNGVLFATTYYVRNGGDNSKSGTSHNNAWSTLEKMESSGLVAGDDVYLCCGDAWSYTGNGKFDINWTGSANDTAFAGAYYWDGSGEVTDYQTVRAAIDSGTQDYPSINGPWTLGYNDSAAKNWDGLISINDPSSVREYICVENIKVTNATGRGINIEADGASGATHHILIRHNYVENTFRNGIVFTKEQVSYVIAEYNYVKDAGWQRGPLPGGGGYNYYSASLNAINDVENIIFRFNTIDRSHGEGIGLYKGCRNCQVYNNRVHGCKSVGIYGLGHNTRVYNNIVTGTVNTDYHRSGPVVGWGIGISNEASDVHWCDDISIYNNLVCFCSVGAWIAVNTLSGQPMDNIKVAHNIFVDNYNAEVRVSRSNGQFSNCEFRNNIFCKYESTGDLSHSGSGNISGFTWDRNCWYDGNTNQPESGCRGQNDVNANPLLSKTRGWQSIDLYSDVSEDDFKITSASPARDEGVLITDFNLDFNGNARDATPDLGAFEYEGASISTSDLIPPVSNLSISVCPNPFSSQTAIKVKCPVSENLKMGIYDLRGSLVKSLSSAGQITWHGRDNRSNSVSNGIYLLKVFGKKEKITTPIFLMR